MRGRTQPRGCCAFCGHETTIGTMRKHLQSCPKRLELMAHASRSDCAPERLFYLRMQDVYQAEFWLDVEVRGSAQLRAIDYYLRAIWLECCDHLSQFSVGGWGGEEISMPRRVASVFDRVPELRHIYDFGTSSETRVKMMGEREGVPLTKHPMVLMARNLPLQFECEECSQPATHVCMGCLTENDEWVTFCDQCAAAHGHEDYGSPIPLVNSPRLGMCGYTGPATPPY